MIETLKTRAEQRAQSAERLPAFDGINLIGIKRKIELILGLIGRHGIFDEYTAHDISHIDSMLDLLEWIVPEDTQKIMSSADWLMSVLAIYFHDVGLLVTRAEYENREKSGFPEFCKTKLFTGDSGLDYKAKVERLPFEQSQRFLYQEFVRSTHAERVREWIMGRAPERLGCAHAAMTEISDLLRPLDPQFKRDLGFICESHHADDLSDFRKYKLSQPYGNSDAETANLQFAALLLRTADLLHITRDRTPSIAFRLINPNDPLSQLEWAKQMAVKRVRPQVGRNKEGLPADSAPRDTVEVHAYFTQPDGFFGLTSYLVYVQKQLQQSHEWATTARDSQGAKHRFPWRFVDDQFIETAGFLRESFGFTLDQARILDLLTGHTLYNDSRVVLRELVQNSLDAIRLRKHIDPLEQKFVSGARIEIHWDSGKRELVVLDTGTGMTQATIERHLLKVGASRYQDPEFKKQYPGFSSISRFGIGVLSTFMVSDQVQIITSHRDDTQARVLNLRSVHGKYLIQLLDKDDERVPYMIREHGTCVKLQMRSSAEIQDVLKTAQYWVMIPDCEVTVTIDGGEAVAIGYSSPADALYASLDGLNYVRWDDPDAESDENKYRTKIRVEQVGSMGLTIAFALSWSEYFKEWSFLNSRQLEQRDGDWRLGTCIEGIRVEREPPGFLGPEGIAAVANARGPGAPKTNVARSGLEQTSEFDNMLRSVYSAYCGHIGLELETMQAERGCSLTWAAQEARYLLRGLLAAAPRSAKLLKEEIEELPLILIEVNGDRQAVSISGLNKEQSFWTIDGQFFRSAERMIREVSSSASLGALVKALDVASVALPEGIVVCDAAVYTQPFDAVFYPKEVDMIRMDRQHRRLDLRWSKSGGGARWATLPKLKMDRFRRVDVPLWVAKSNVEVEGRTDESAVRCLGRTFLLPGSKVGDRLLQWLLRVERESDEASTFFAVSLWSCVHELLLGKLRDLRTADDWRQYFEGNRGQHRELLPSIDFEDLARVLGDDQFKVFDSAVWVRREGEV